MFFFKKTKIPPKSSPVLDIKSYEAYQLFVNKAYNCVSSGYLDLNKNIILFEHLCLACYGLFLTQKNYPDLSPSEFIQLLKLKKFNFKDTFLKKHIHYKFYKKQHCLVISYSNNSLISAKNVYLTEYCFRRPYNQALPYLHQVEQFVNSNNLKQNTINSNISVKKIL